jgi:putative transposase
MQGSDLTPIGHGKLRRPRHPHNKLGQPECRRPTTAERCSSLARGRAPANAGRDPWTDIRREPPWYGWQMAMSRRVAPLAKTRSNVIVSLTTYLCNVVIVPQSFSAISVHIVFSTKNRAPFLRDAEFRSQIHSYLAGTLKGLGCQPIEVGGVSDHVHLLTALGRGVAVSDLVKELKTSSNSVIRRKGEPNFGWQVGYGAFSVSHSANAAVARYIREQDVHHQRLRFQEEFRRLLVRHGIEFDERYLWG